MATKSILLAVSDPELLLEITDALGGGWETTSAASEAEALAQLEKRSFDALLADFNLSSADSGSSTDASELLNQALEKHPNSIQFLFVHEADLALVAAKVLGSPHILPKPIEPASLKSRIENALKDSNSIPTTSEPANLPGEAPKTPPIYAEVLKALESPEVTHEQVGQIIARDAALTAEVLNLANSSYLHWPGNIARPAEAVESLGLETVKAIVLALQFLAEHSRMKPGYLSLDQVWQHSIKVGQIARDLVLLETKDRTLASQTFAAGLLHDLGKVVLATNFQDLYGRVYSLASKQPVAIWDIEKEMFGANHGEIGACLVGMWNMPAAIVDAAALHHEPPVDEQEQITPLAAVHIANVLEHELRPGEKDLMVNPIIHTPFLNQLGLLQRLPIWRAAFANRRSSLNPQSELESAEAAPSRSTVPSSARGSRTAQPPAVVRETRPTALGHPLTGHRTPEVPLPFYRKTWVHATAAAFLVLLTVWLTPRPKPNQVDPVYARTTDHDQVPRLTSPSLETAAVASPQVEPSSDVPDQSVAPTTPIAAAQPAPTEAVAASLPAPEPVRTTPAAVASATPANRSPTTNSTSAPAIQGSPAFRLKGIIYSSRPSAILNGQMVSTGDKVDGATVVHISRTTVTVQINGERKIIELR